MISKMNYLLLSAMMVAAIDSTFGRGCDCCKKLCADKDSNESCIKSDNNNTMEDELTQKNVNTMHINNNDNIISNNNFTKNIGNNNNIENINENNITFPENLENNNNIENMNETNNSFQVDIGGNDNMVDMSLVLDNGININAIVSDTKDLQEDDQQKVIDLVNLLLKKKVICHECIKNIKEENKIVLVYDVSKKDKVDGYDLKSVSFNFGSCEQHKKKEKCPINGCDNNAYYITWCGHKVCENCLKSRAGKKDGFWVCVSCNAVCCNCFFQENFFTHIWCNYNGGGHYVCFNGQDEVNPLINKSVHYIEDTWICHAHQAAPAQ